MTPTAISVVATPCGNKRQRRPSWLVSTTTRSTVTTHIDDDDEDEALFAGNCEDDFRLRLRNALNYRIATKCPFLIQRREECGGSDDSTHSLGRKSEEQHVNAAGSDTVAVLDLSEIVAGEMLGRGSFCDVFAIDRIRLDPSDHHRCSCTNTNSVVQTRRRALADNSCSERQHRYVLKRLRNPGHHHHHRWYFTRHHPAKQPRASEAFLQAAVDLAMEAKYLASLQHPNIITLRALPASCTNGGFLVMDRVDTTLQECLGLWRHDSNGRQHNPFHRRLHHHGDQHHPGVVPHNDWWTKLTLVLQVADAIVFLHERNLVYRDLAPSNIGLQQSTETGVWQCKLIDFGLVREVPVGPHPELHREETFCMSLAGTVPYMAPCILATGEYNLKADVYSWSMILWELLTLQHPFSDTGHGLSRDLYRQFVCEMGERPPLEGQLPDLQDLLQHGWAQDLKERWTMANVQQRVVQILQEHEEAANVGDHEREERTKESDGNDSTCKFTKLRHRQRSPRALLEYFAHLSHFHNHLERTKVDNCIRSVASAEL